MRLPGRSPLRAAAAALVLLSACADRTDPVRATAPGVDAPGGAAAAPIATRTLACVGDARAKRLSCAPARPSTGTAAADIVVDDGASQVSLASSNTSYDSGTGAYTFDVTVRNLISQPLGTADGLSLSPNGVRVIFVRTPYATFGSGTITVAADGTGTFAELAGLESAYPGVSTTSRPYYQYNTVLDPYETSPPKTWRFNVPSTVATFAFDVVVLAPVAFPRGYVDITGSNVVRSGRDQQLTGVVRDSLGRALSGRTITWSSGDTLFATVGPAGLVHGLRAGYVAIQAQSQIHPGVYVTGSFPLTVSPTRRFWTGAAGTTDWFDGDNWATAAGTDSVAPVATDTAVLADTLLPAAANYPVLTANAAIGGVEVELGGINLAAFNLTASGDVFTDLAGGGQISGTSGRLVLTGLGRTVRGVLPRTQVEGTYTLDGNINVQAPLTVLRGTLTSTSFRVQVRSF